jgi:ABC-type transport system involved in multi-copper enzyme maturation permease subunit
MKILTLITFTFRELLTKATIYVLAGISTLILLGVLAGFSSSSGSEGTTILLFGNPIGPAMPAHVVAEFVNQMLAGFAKGMFAGVVLFGIFATAGIVPEVLEKGTVDLYLSKPLARWELLIGKYLGGVCVVLVNIFYFLGGMSLIFGVRMGIWDFQFLISSIMLTFVFACLYAVVCFLGVVFRNAAIPIIGAFLYLLIVGPILQQREQGLFMISQNGVYHGIINGFYYLLPQLAGMMDGVSNLIVRQDIDWRPFVQSLVTSGLFLGAGTLILNKRDF